MAFKIEMKVTVTVQIVITDCMLKVAIMAVSRICEECKRTHHNTSRLCHRCTKQNKGIDEMHERQGGEGKPIGVILLPFGEIHYLCICTWVYDHNSKMHRLKYMNMACMVIHWHRQLVPLNGGSLSLIFNPQ